MQKKKKKTGYQCSKRHKSPKLWVTLMVCSSSGGAGDKWTENYHNIGPYMSNVAHNGALWCPDKRPQKYSNHCNWHNYVAWKMIIIAPSPSRKNLGGVLKASQAAATAAAAAALPTWRDFSSWTLSLKSCESLYLLLHLHCFNWFGIFFFFFICASHLPLLAQQLAKC